MYRTLDPDKIIETLERLARRIQERFPDSGLERVCWELVEVSRASKAKVKAISEPNVWLRGGIAIVVLVGLGILGYVLSIIEIKRDAENLFGVLQGIEALINTLVLTGAGVFFLTTLESRWSRQRALADLHELRSIVHVIDMHQLTKDPSRAGITTSTVSSPPRALTPFELSRYLDYCSEMLSLCAKLAALYAQGTKDPVIVEAASDLDRTTANLSNKIWQKITIVERHMASDADVRTVPGPPASAATAKAS